MSPATPSRSTSSSHLTQASAHRACLIRAARNLASEMEDRYQVLEQLGTGGMATVHKAQDRLLGRQVAVKRLLPHLANDPRAAERFRREAQAAAALNHPGIVTVYDTGSDEAGPYIVMELIEGETLASLIARKGPMGAGETAAILSGAAEALDHAHRNGVVHRDIKPSNLIVDADGTVRITDFGIARAMEDPTVITTTEELAGTLTYMAPEIASGDPASASSDIYSLGVVAFEMLSGEPPFAADNVAALLSAIRDDPPPGLGAEVPAEVASAVMRALEKSPDRRPDSAMSLTTSLLAGTTIPMPSESPAASDTTIRIPASERDDTVVMAAPNNSVGMTAKSRGPLVLLAAFIAVLSLALLAYNLRPEGAPAAVDSTTTTLGTATTSTTTATTSTSNPPSTTLSPDDPASIAMAITDLLAGLKPPEFKPKEVRDIAHELDEVLKRAEEDDRDRLAESLEKAFEKVTDLDESPERDQLEELFIRLAEAYGFNVSRPEED